MTNRINLAEMDSSLSFWIRLNRRVRGERRETDSICKFVFLMFATMWTRRTGSDR